MASELFIGQSRPRPKRFLAYLLLFLILGTCLASAATGADYVRGNGGAAVPDDRPPSAPTAFSMGDDRCVLIAAAPDGEPLAFLLWRLRPSVGAMTLTVYGADKMLPGSGVPLAALFGDGGRVGCEAVCAALTRARVEAPSHYVVLTKAALRALSERTGGSLVTAPPEDGAADARVWGDVWAALCERFFTAERTDELRADFTALVNAADTDLSVSHFAAYRDALTALAAGNAGRQCTVFMMGTGRTP